VPADALSPAAKEPFDLYGWIAKHPIDKVEPQMKAALKTLKEEYGIKKVGAVGYCFGGRYVIRFLGEGIIDAGVRS
jgi:dienelactone hydrolase